MLNRQAGQIDFSPLPDDFLAWGGAELTGRHVPNRLDQRAQTEHIAQTFGRLWFFQGGEQVAYFAQLAHIIRTHTHGHPLGGTKQVTQYRHRVPNRLSKQQGRAARTQGAVTQLGHFQVRGNGQAHFLQFARLF